MGGGGVCEALIDQVHQKGPFFLLASLTKQPTTTPTAATPLKVQNTLTLTSRPLMCRFAAIALCQAFLNEHFQVIIQGSQA